MPSTSDSPAGQVRLAASRRRSSLLLAALVGLVTLFLAACGSSSSSGGSSGGGGGTLRLGYFPTVTHAPALYGVQSGGFQKALGSVKLQPKTFNAGPAAIEALLSGSLDASFVGPNPAVNAYVQSHGQAVRVVSGATSGGAELVVKSDITTPGQLKGKKLATPQLGNTQDVALRTWLKSQGLSANPNGGGDVTVLPQDNGATVTAFEAGQLDGAWVPQPYAAQLVEAGGHVLVNERSLWPNGQFATTVLLVRADYLQTHRAVVEDLIRGELAALDALQHDPNAQAVVNQGLVAATGKSLKDATLEASFADLTFTDDPLQSTIQTSAQHAAELGLLEGGNPDLSHLVDLSALNDVLRSQGKPVIQS